jgi:hypothetical protein
METSDALGPLGGAGVENGVARRVMQILIATNR